MLIKTIMNQSEKFKSFVYDKFQFEMVNSHKFLIVNIKPGKT